MLCYFLIFRPSVAALLSQLYPVCYGSEKHRPVPAAAPALAAAQRLFSEHGNQLRRVSGCCWQAHGAKRRAFKGAGPRPRPGPGPAGQPRLLRAPVLELSPLPTIPLPFPSLRRALRPVSRPCRLPASFLPPIVALPPAGKRLRAASPAALPAAGRAGRPRGAAGPRRGGGPGRWGRGREPRGGAERRGPGGRAPGAGARCLRRPRAALGHAPGGAGGSGETRWRGASSPRLHLQSLP